MALISVIIPMYKSEKYIRACLQSVLDQTYKNIEIICVDDASPEKESVIVKEIMKEDSRVKLIKHNKNLGLGGARNTGISAAQGEYIASVDSDDLMYPQLIETAYKATECGKYDIVSFGYERINEREELISTHEKRNLVLKNGEFNIFYTTNPAFWNKIWKRNLYENIKFPNHLYYQDLATTPRIYNITKNLKCIPDILYRYRVHNNTITFSYSDKHIIDLLKVFLILKKYLIVNSIDNIYKDILVKRITDAFSYHMKNVKRILDDENYSKYIEILNILKFGLVDYIDNKLLDKLELEYAIEKCNYRCEIPCANCLTLPISVLIKTFIRPKSLERLLISIAEYQKIYNIKFSEILICDDSPEKFQRSNENIIETILKKYININIKHYKIDKYIGLSGGRNILVKNASQKYILLLDDDFIMDDECDIRNTLDCFNSNNVDIIGGWLKNNYNMKTGTFDYWGSVGEIIETKSSLIFNLNERNNYHNKIENTDFILNFFVAKRESILKNLWNENLACEEHHEFFYRAKINKLKIIFFKDLFIKHTNRNENSEEYNSIRYGKEHWEKYLSKSLKLMDKSNRIVNRTQYGQFISWKISSIDQNISKQIRIPLYEQILEQIVEVKRLTNKFGQCFCGYYDVKCYDQKSNSFIYHKITTHDTLPIYNTDFSEIIIKNLSTNKEITIGKTYCWNHQQGANAQFLNICGETYIIYNDFDFINKQYISKKINIKNLSSETHPYPIASINRDYTKIISYNFSRIYDYRPGYGYNNISDPYFSEDAPKEDGLYVYNLEDDSKSFFMSYYEIYNFIIKNYNNKIGKIVINHASFSPDTKKIFILVREFNDTPPYPTYSLVVDLETRNIKKIFGFVSHYNWKDNNTIIVSGSIYMDKKSIKSINVYEIDVNNLNYKIIGEKYFYTDGHCSYSPNREYLLYDSYCNTKFPYRALYLYKFSTNQCLVLGYFYSPSKFFANNSDLRCDLHPRWEDDGKLIMFDSIHEGFRAAYTINIEKIENLFNNNINQLSKNDLMIWYDSKYNKANQIDKSKTNNMTNNKVNSTINKKTTEVNKFYYNRKLNKLIKNPKQFFLDSKTILHKLHIFFK